MFLKYTDMCACAMSSAIKGRVSHFRFLFFFASKRNRNRFASFSLRFAKLTNIFLASFRFILLQFFRFVSPKFFGCKFFTSFCLVRFFMNTFFPFRFNNVGLSTSIMNKEFVVVSKEIQFNRSCSILVV